MTAPPPAFVPFSSPSAPVLLVNTGKPGSPFFFFLSSWITLLMVLGHSLKSLTHIHSLKYSVFVQCVFALLLSSVFSCFCSLACYYRDMKEYSCQTHIDTRNCPHSAHCWSFTSSSAPQSTNAFKTHTHTLSAVFDSLSAGLHWAYLVDIVKLLYPECCWR